MKKSAAIIVLAALILVADVYGNTFGFIRDGAIYVRGGDGVSVNVSYQPGWQMDTHKAFVYFQSPTGELLEYVEIDFGDTSGSFSFSLDAGFGDYVITFAAKTYRKYTVEIPDGVPAVFRPPRFHISSQLTDSMSVFYFYSPGTDSFTLNARKDFNSTVDSVRLYDPSGVLVASLSLPGPSFDAYYPFDSHTVANPDEGYWRIEFPDVSWYGNTAFWLDGLPNDFSRTPGDWFAPALLPGTTIVDGAGVIGGTGLIGASANWNPSDELLQGIEEMGLESNNYYVDQNWREPVNDNADPFDFNWSGFNWGDDWRVGVYTGEPYNLELTHLFAPADWLGVFLTTQNQRDEFAELLEAYLIHHNVTNGIGIQYVTPLDEPNFQGYTLNDYAQLASTMGSRKNASPYAEVSSVKLLIPGSSQFEEASNGWGREWAESIYALYDEDVDGINFHQWQWRNLLNLHRYREEVLLAHDIIATWDSDGDTIESIIIDQTNICWGEASSPYEVNTFFASLWWVGVICNTMGTGYVDVVNWFPLIDDVHHMKGLMSGNYAVKPVGYATKFLIEHKLDSVIQTSASHPEIDVLATVDGALHICDVIAVNKFERVNDVTFNIMLPADMPSAFALEIHKLREGMTESVLDSSGVFSGTLFNIQYRFEPRTIYAFRLDGSPGVVPEAPTVVIHRSGSDAVLTWGSTGAAFYRVFSAASPEGPFATFEGSTSDTTWTHSGVIESSDVIFYHVFSTSQP